MRRRRGFDILVVLLALLAFCAIAVIPWVEGRADTPPWVSTVKHTSPVPLPSSPPTLTTVTLPAVAQPIQADGPVAKPPTGDGNFLPTLVSNESNRLRVLLQSSVHMTLPGVVNVSGSVTTLVLPGRPSPYDFADLLRTGAVIPWDKPDTYMLLDSVFVAPSATLDIGGANVGTLLMNTAPSAFTSIVTWEGTINITGSAKAPITISGWNNGPATDANLGRPYLRAVGGDLTLAYVQTSSLGFWSGVTGGVSWTGTSYRPATGGATHSRFMGDTYGAFVEGAEDVQFSDDLFESNQVDGLRLHRDTDNSTVSASAAVRNGANGFVISRGSHDVLTGDVALHNADNGFLINAQPRVNGASPSGGSTLPSSGLVLTGGEADGNGRSGILLEGGLGTILSRNLVCGKTTAVAIRLGATDTSVVGNDVSCGKNIALSIGPGVTSTTVSDNTLSHSDIGVMILSSPSTRLLDNHLSALSVFGISVRGTSPGSAGSGNVIAGRGFEPIQVTYGTTAPTFVRTNLTAWERRTSATVMGYLLFHPLLLTWLIILILVTFFCIVTRLRRRPQRLYAHALPWRVSSAIPWSRPGPSAAVVTVSPQSPSTPPASPKGATAGGRLPLPEAAPTMARANSAGSGFEPTTAVRAAQNPAGRR
ncbi:MAG: right-handed parallel beta-helix repeat-containing protein [Candidatus Dormiibacterota bacterium]